MKCTEGWIKLTSAAFTKETRWVCVLKADGSCSDHVRLTTSQMRRLAAMLTRAANRIDAKRKRGAK